MLRHFLFFSKADRRAIVVLLILFAVGLTWIFFQEYTSSERKGDGKKGNTVAYVKVPLHSDPFSRHHSNYYDTRSSVLFPFDPNTADSATLARLGLARWQVSHILHYRAHKGTFHKPEDLARIYGLDKETFERLRPYIRISKAFQPAPRDTSRRRVPSEKFTHPVTLNLNATDTVELKHIPRIGSYYARAILRYGERLGGYVSVEQLSEIDGLSPEVRKWFIAKPTAIRKLNLNAATFKQLLRHPYLNYEQVKAIVKHRDKFGRLTSLQQLSLIPAFTPKDLDRLEPYVSF